MSFKMYLYYKFTRNITKRNILLLLYLFGLFGGTILITYYYDFVIGSAYFALYLFATLIVSMIYFDYKEWRIEHIKNDSGVDAEVG